MLARRTYWNGRSPSGGDSAPRRLIWTGNAEYACRIRLNPAAARAGLTADRPVRVNDDHTPRGTQIAGIAASGGSRGPVAARSLVGASTVGPSAPAEGIKLGGSDLNCLIVSNESGEIIHAAANRFPAAALTAIPRPTTTLTDPMRMRSLV